MTAGDEPVASDDEVRRLLDRLADAEAEVAEVRAAHASSRRFVANAAHQLRTPITGIQASAEALLRGVATGDRDTLLANVVRETSRATRIVADLLKLARVDNGHPLKPAPCDLVKVCSDEVSRAWSLAPRLDVRLRAPSLEWHVEVDEFAVREIVSNLLDNARRHAETEVVVELESSDESVEVRVRDDGPGVPDDQAERIFERFTSLDGLGGTGLGLAIARELSRAHKGDLRYEGRAFVLRLPLVSKNI